MLILDRDEGVIGRCGSEGTAPNQGIDLRRQNIQRRPVGQGQKKDHSVLGLKTVYIFFPKLSPICSFYLIMKPIHLTIKVPIKIKLATLARVSRAKHTKIQHKSYFYMRFPPG